MSVTPLTLDEARQMIGEVFVYHMPFNRELGLQLTRFEQDYAEITFDNHDKLVGNIAQRILHGGVIAAVLDVAAGLVCVGNSLVRHEPLIKEQLQMKLAKMGTIDLRVDYLRPGRGEHFIASSSILRSGNKVSVARVELHNDQQMHIASATATYLVG
ncbi:thioesterase family protein [Yersinia massiliensis]|uniref:thioesterase family protein n=1 Tax=Yersinia massiliensis TaxID=419257 RepID=UPI0003004B39|nr:thioesterase family protein [Yersinia massiliensis]